VLLAFAPKSVEREDRVMEEELVGLERWGSAWFALSAGCGHFFPL
jgi:hypothetical protein